MSGMSGNSVSHVWREGDWVYKRQPKFLTDNEVYALRLMRGTGYVPEFEQIDEETVRTRFIEKQSITDHDRFRVMCRSFLWNAWSRGIRHGDLTTYSVIPHDNKPMVIDWAESRHLMDPRPDKRREGDKYWMEKTMEELIDEST